MSKVLLRLKDGESLEQFSHPFSSHLWIIVAKGIFIAVLQIDQDLKPREVKLSLKILFFYPISGTERILDSRPKPRSPRLCIALDVTASYKSRATALLTKREK